MIGLECLCGIGLKFLRFHLPALLPALPPLVRRKRYLECGCFPAAATSSSPSFSATTSVIIAARPAITSRYPRSRLPMPAKATVSASAAALLICFDQTAGRLARCAAVIFDQVLEEFKAHLQPALTVELPTGRLRLEGPATQRQVGWLGGGGWLLAMQAAPTAMDERQTGESAISDSVRIHITSANIF